MKGRGMMMISALCAVILTGCGLLRKEEEVVNQITIPSYDAGSAEYGYVKRGDLENLETLFLKLGTIEEHELSFGVSGIAYDEVYVKEGDSVERGELLAKLESEEIETELIMLEAEAGEIALEIEHTEALVKEFREKKYYNKKQIEVNQEEIGRCLLRLNELANDKAVNESRTAEQKKMLDKRCIYADMDGTVAKIENHTGDSLSDERQPFLVLHSSGKVFTGDTGEENDFVQGQEIRINIEGESFPAVFKTVKRENGITSVEVGLTMESELPENCSYGEIVWSNGVAKDALYVPEKALVISQGETYVFLLEKDGFARPVKVQTGTTSGNYVQIVGGLKEDDVVMLY